MKGIRTGILLALVILAACGPQAIAPSATPTGSPSPVVLPDGPTVVASVSPEASGPPEVRLLSELAGVEYVIPLTVQHAWPGGATVYFELAQPSRVSLLTAMEDSESWHAADSVEGESFVLTIRNLVPGAIYKIAVGVPDPRGDYRPPSHLGAMWGPIRLHVPEEEPAAIRLVALGDSGYGDPVTPQIAHVAAAYAPDATLHLGDLVYRGEEEGTPQEAYARKFYFALEPLLESGPIYPVLGNHELDGPVQGEDGPYYYSAFPLLPEWCCEEGASPDRREWYRVTWGTWQFLFLNSQAFYGHGDLAAQNAWLDLRLGDPAFSATIPLMHIAAFSAGLHISDGAPLRSSWHPRFVEAEVPFVLAGHDHNYERILVDGVTYLVSGGGSAVLYSRQTDLPGEMKFSAQNHFLVIDLVAGQFTVRAITQEDQVIDEYTWP